MVLIPAYQRSKELQQVRTTSRRQSSAFFDRETKMTRIKAAKQKAILDVAESLGYSFRRLSGHIYEHPEHDSFRIFADTNTFKWFSRDIQGDVIDFVQLVAGVTFKEAVSYLKNGDFEQAKLIEETYQPFQYYLHE